MSITKTGSRPKSFRSEVTKPRSSEPAKADSLRKSDAAQRVRTQQHRDSFEPAAPSRRGATQLPRLSEFGSHSHDHGSEGVKGSGGSLLGKGAAPTVSTDASGRTVVELGSGNDNATLSQTADGGLEIRSNGHSVTLTAEQARDAVIRGGDGHDTITADASVTQAVRIEGGAGDDRIEGGAGDDRLSGGEGNDVILGKGGDNSLRGEAGDDYLEGGAGNDRVYGGDGRDVMYGLDGEDRMYGGNDRDYIDGGRGDDVASGGAGDDQVIGGRGDDILLGGDGNDAVAGGQGSDTIRGGAGSDKLYTEADDTVRDLSSSDTQQTVDMTDADSIGSSVSVSGSDEFSARVESDLDALRSLPVGQELLRDLDASGRSTTIQETSGGNSAGGTNFSDGFMSVDGTPGKGTDSQVNYNTSRISLGGEEWMTRPPVVGLEHELVHAWDLVNGKLAPGETSGTRNLENAAVGLPYDHDGDPSTPVHTPDRPTENQLRDELNLPTRPRY